ncbi:MAG: SLC13 family permease, partial [Candidatus Thioglobus sp.]
MSDQELVFALIATLFVFFAYNRFRYDVVAFGALAIASIIGVVPKEEVFSGFGHPAVIIVALVLVVGRGLVYAGVVELITQKLAKFISGIGSQIAVMGSAAALLSSVINNIAALAILMPSDIQLNKKAKRNPALTLMPLSFASILGGMVTMIGTAPNVVIATYRGEALG